MTTDIKSMIDEYEEEIQRIASIVRRLTESLPQQEGKDIENTYRKIKIYGSMIDDLIYSQYKMKAYAY